MKTYVFIDPPALVADRFQLESQASHCPYGFLKIFSFYKRLRVNCHFIDMNIYEHEVEFGSLPLYKYIRCGNTSFEKEIRIMGIQPNRLDEEMIELFISSNVKSITIPLESANKNMMRYFRKPYNFNDILNSVLKLYKGGFDFRRSHFTFMLGYPEDDIEGIIGCYLIPIMVGGIPQPFPLTLTPKTLDYKRYYNLISNKDLAELNGNLFPLARSNEEFLIKEKLLSIFNSKDINLVRRGLSDISDNYKKSFDEQYEILYQFFNH